MRGIQQIFSQRPKSAPRFFPLDLPRLMRPSLSLPSVPEHEVRIHLRIAKEDVVVLGGILLGYEGLVSLQGEPKQSADAPHIIALVTTSGLVNQLDELLSELAHEVSFERVLACP